MFYMLTRVPINVNSTSDLLPKIISQTPIELIGTNLVHCDQLKIISYLVKKVQGKGFPRVGGDRRSGKTEWNTGCVYGV